MFGLKREKLDMVVPARLSWLQLIVLWLVIISFVMFGFVAWGMGRGSVSGGGGPAAVAIKVAGSHITQNEFLRQLRDTESRYRQQFSGQDEDFFQRLNVPRQVANSLVTQKIALAQARRLGLTATDTEVRDYVMKAFVDDNGVFLGSEAVDRYQSRLGLSDERFRGDLADDIVVGKLQDLLRAGVIVTDDEVKADYLRANDRAKAEYIWLDAQRLAGSSVPSDDEVQTYYTDHPAEFEVEERSARYVVFDAAEHEASAVITDADLAAAHERGVARGNFDEKRRARHILLSTSNLAEAELAAVEGRARELAAQARAGADFAALATLHSDDTVSAERGGDLGLFGRGAMVPPFETAAFALRPGEISDPVKSNFGFHVIKLEEIQPPRTLAEARSELETEVRLEKSLTAAREAAEAAIDSVVAGGDLAHLAGTVERPVHELDFFAAELPPASIDGLDAAYRATFARALFGVAEEGGLARVPVVAGRRAAVVQYVRKRGPVVPPLTAIRSRVVAAVQTARGRATAREKSAQLAATIANGASLADAATELGEELQTAGPFARDGAFPGVPGSEAAMPRAYAAAVGTIADPIELDGGVLWYRLTERFAFEQSAYEAEKATTHDRLASARASQDYASLLQSLRKDLESRNEIQFLTPELLGPEPGLVF